jgi:hypothetical protein
VLVRTDDEMHRVDRTYLGPKGRRFPWRATYRAYAVWIVVTVLLAGLMLEVGAEVSAATVLLLLLASTLVTIRVMKVIDHDRPLLAMGVMCVHEVIAPRPVTPRDKAETYDVEARVSRWRAGARPAPRWFERFRAHHESADQGTDEDTEVRDEQQ